jgi:Zn-dependent protease with chaperone function
VSGSRIIQISGTTGQTVDDWVRVLGRAEDRAQSIRLRALMRQALSSFPSEVPPLRSVAEIRMRKRAIQGTVGLTTYRSTGSSPGGGRKKADDGTQTITFYSELFDRLSDEAAEGVIVHELAHAWLNEHVTPRSSKRREKEADELARTWGYGRYLDALDAETDPY